MQYLDAISKRTEWSLFLGNPSLCPNEQCWRSWSWKILWRPTRPFRSNTQKRCPFHYRGLECKRRKSRDTWNNRQIWLWNTKWSRAEAHRVLPKECTGHSKHPLPTTQEKTLHMHIHQMVNWNQIDYILCSQRWRSSIQSAKTRLGADCGSDHELLITKIRLKLKKVGKTTRPLRYDLNQIPYNYIVERFHIGDCVNNFYCESFLSEERIGWDLSQHENLLK